MLWPATAHRIAPLRPLRSPPVATVLLVEDNLDNRFIYRTILEHHGHTVHEAEDGVEGVRLAQELQPDVILMNIAMPNMTGWEAVELLKGHPRTRRIPVITLTGHGSTEDEHRARGIGFDLFIRKPAEPLNVVDAVEAFTQTKQE